MSASGAWKTIRVHAVMSPNGAGEDSPGHRLGNADIHRSGALKGRFRSVGEWELARPFRAWESFFGLESQGGALGCLRTPRWGWGGGTA